MIDHKELKVLPREIQSQWGARLAKAEPTEAGVLRLVNIRPTQPKSYEEQRIIVLVVDENGLPMAGVPVAFSYSTADPFYLDEGYLWTPPNPRRAFIVPTDGSGQIDMIQGSAVKPGGPGGITVYPLEPDFSSDYVTGAGMLADHTGLHLTYQLRRVGVQPLGDVISELKRRVELLEDLSRGMRSQTRKLGEFDIFAQDHPEVRTAADKLDGGLWRAGEVFSERELGLIANSNLYALNDPAGLPGHNLLVLIDKLDTLVALMAGRLSYEELRECVEVFKKDRAEY
jgi:hypothetical protein